MRMETERNLFSLKLKFVEPGSFPSMKWEEKLGKFFYSSVRLQQITLNISHVFD